MRFLYAIMEITAYSGLRRMAHIFLDGVGRRIYGVFLEFRQR